MGAHTVGEKVHETGGLHEKHNMLEALAIEEWNEHTFREVDCIERPHTRNATWYLQDGSNITS